MNECIDSNAVASCCPRRLLALRNEMYRFTSDRGRYVISSVLSSARTGSDSDPSVAIQVKHFTVRRQPNITCRTRIHSSICDSDLSFSESSNQEGVNSSSEAEWCLPFVPYFLSPCVHRFVRDFGQPYSFQQLSLSE